MSRLALGRLLTDGGQDLVEYALLVGLPVVAIAVAVSTLVTGNRREVFRHSGGVLMGTMA